MALIEGFREVTGERDTIHGPVECGWRSFAVDGRHVVQLDTYGSSDRENPGKQSQSVQLDETAAQELVEILASAFKSLTWPGDGPLAL